MHILQTHFQELLKNIRPPADRLEAAKVIPAKVREYLKQHQSFETLAPHSRLAGSYAQDTCVGDVKDVDFLVRVDGDHVANDPDAKDVIQNLKTALDGLPEYLGYSGSTGIDIERARRSVHVYFQDEDFHIDAVPCIAPNGFEEVIYVPDRGFNEWIASHPLGYIALIQDLNQAHHDKVRPLIKSLKHFRDFQMKNRKPKSYWLGALVIHHVQNGLDTEKSLAELFAELLDAIYNRYRILLATSDTATPSIPDPILGHDISWNWQRTHFETFMRRINECRIHAKIALECEDRDDAIRLWQKIFGQEFFPSDVGDAASRNADMSLPGFASVTRTGLIIASGSESRKAISIPRTTFHGKT